jgi:ATP-dependent RNA helicase SUPV3L1/SUV3
VLGSRTPPGSTITALLGPTNTGKTHRCVSRMLEYDSGMIGLPLRLLAREVYERVQREAGPESVAFITGEERHVPRGARYWVCTTEAMPVEREVDFLAVDEIQLSASPTRGHVFTDRLLHARGRFETWFLGAATMRPIIAELVPTAHFRSAERLSKLRFTGAIPLAKLPSRAAVVAFSTPRVYEIAERLRVRKGGVAVVLGALSPKTRNAQVAMYQAGEVDHLVATDAIGMGLNMSLSHVALSALHKFDGRVQRALSDAELAQIAGRAGRSIHDGTFGTIEPLHLSPHTASLIEHHVFPAVQQLTWRNNDLEFTSVDKLLTSLLVTPKQARLRLVQQADDASALERLAFSGKVRSLATNEAMVRLLWDVCQIPDYRKLLPELHADLLFDLFEHLVVSGGQLDNDWMASKVNPLTTETADLDTLLARLAAIRTWTYVSQRDDWVGDVKHWRERTRAVEEQLSDRLHERLIARFVVRTRNAPKRHQSFTKGESPRFAAANVTKIASPSPRSDSDSAQQAEADPHHPFAALKHLKLSSERSPNQTDDLPLSEQVWALEPDGSIYCGARKVAILRRGESLIRPTVQVVTSESGGDRGGLHGAALRATRKKIDELLKCLDAGPAATPAVRGICYQLSVNLGVVLRKQTLELLPELDSNEVTQLQELGIVVGEGVIFSKRLLNMQTHALRQLLVSTYYQTRLELDPRRVSQRKAVSPHLETAQENAALALGFVPAGPLWLRCDALERVLIQARDVVLAPSVLCSSLGCKRRELNTVLEALELLGAKFQHHKNPVI